MNSSEKRQAKKVAANLAQRFAALALPIGFSVGEFFAASKEAFIEAATEDLKKRGIRPTTSRIAVMTGLTRAEVARIREGMTTLPSAVSEPRTERVMHAWFTDPEFLDKDGNPRLLPEFGKISFASLVKKHSGDMPRRALLEELIAGGMARRETPNEVLALRRHYHAEASAKLNFPMLDAQIDLAVSNPSSVKTHAVTVEFSGPLSPAVHRTVSQRTERFLEAISDYLHAEAEKAKNHAGNKKVNVKLVISHGESISIESIKNESEKENSKEV